MFLRAIAYGCVAGAAFAIAKGILCTVFGWGGAVSSAIHNVPLQLFNQVMASLASFPVGLGSLHPFSTALRLVSVNIPDVIIYRLKLVSLYSLIFGLRLVFLYFLFYLLDKVARMVVRRVAGMF